MLQVAERVAAHDTSVLLIGETGTGKDRLAEGIHLASGRRSGPFVRIECAAIPLELFEAELFGHEKGAFTDARERRTGRLELASGGTVYLDEITELPRAAQAKLLRVLQQRTVTRLGGGDVPVDIRVIASSSAAPERLGELVRSDLMYRIDVVRIELPPLRERRDDIPMLARRLLRERRPDATLSREASERLREHDWPGNVRELQNALESALVRSEAATIEPQHLPLSVQPVETQLERAAAAMWPLERLEAEYIRRIVAAVGGNYSRAASILGIHRKTLLEKRRRYGIDFNRGEG